MVWARPSLTHIREKLECRSLKAIAHQGYGHMLAVPHRRLSCLLSASFATDTMWVAPFGKGILEYGIQRRTPARRITGMRMNTLSAEG